jgi:hypothetical protein
VRFIIAGPVDPEAGDLDPDRLYWSNEDGWGHRKSATVFDDPNVSNPIEWHHREVV